MSRINYYIYKEYHNEEEKVRITQVFDNKDDLIEEIEQRKRFYNVFPNEKMTITIEIVCGKDKGEE